MAGAFIRQDMRRDMAPNESIAKECTILFAMEHAPATVSTKLLYLKLLLDYPISRETYKNPRRRNKMIKTTYSTMLLVIGFLALMLMLPSAHLMAQATEEHRSSESSSSSTVQAPPPVQEQHSSESSSITTRSTTVAPPEHCVSRCREHYNLSLRECNEPNHPNHNKCEKWAREQEQECLNACK